MTDSLLAAVLGPDPHPEFAAATVPTNEQVLMAVSVLGWLPETRWEPIVRALETRRRHVNEAGLAQ